MVSNVQMVWFAMTPRPTDPLYTPSEGWNSTCSAWVTAKWAGARGSEKWRASVVLQDGQLVTIRLSSLAGLAGPNPTQNHGVEFRKCENEACDGKIMKFEGKNISSSALHQETQLLHVASGFRNRPFWQLQRKDQRWEAGEMSAGISALLPRTRSPRGAINQPTS